MAEQISKLAIKVTADSSQFSQGLGTAQSKINDFVEKAKGLSLGSILGGAGFGAGIVGVVTGAISGIISTLDHLKDKFRETKMQAEQLGIGLEQTEMLKNLSGGNEEAVFAFLNHFDKVLGEAAAGSEE